MATPGWVHRALGRMLACYLRLVQRTNRLRVDPPDLYERLDAGCAVHLRACGMASIS